MAKGAIELGQMPLWLPESNWRPPVVSELPSWRGAKRVSVDTEFYDPQLEELGLGVRRDGTFMAGFSFAIEDGPEHYVPLRHVGGDNVPNPDAALQYLRDQAKAFDGELVGMNLSCDLDWLAQEDVNFSPKAYRDVSVADPLIWELHFQYGLDAIAARHGLPGKEPTLIREAARAYGLNPKIAIPLLPARFVGLYGEVDARRPLQILRRQERVIEKEDLNEVWELESKLLPILVKMRRRGVRVDFDRLARVERFIVDELRTHLGIVHDITGLTLSADDVWKPEPFARALERVGIKVPTTATGAPSITKGLFVAIEANAADGSNEQRVARSLVRARKVSKLQQFADQVRAHAIGDRIHCTFNQLRNSGTAGNEFSDGKKTKERGGRFGRLSSEGPNLQQQPARDDFAAMWRAIYLPEHGCEWTSGDYSQQEPRMLVYYAERLKLEGAHAAAQAYRDDPTTDNHDMMTRLIYGAQVDEWDAKTFKLKRGQCKNIFLGKCYGEGGAKLCDDLGLPTRWAVFMPRSRERGYVPPSYFETREEAFRFLHGIEGGRCHRVAGEEGQAIMDNFDRRLPFVGELAKRCEKKAKRLGVIRTLMGRRCHFPRLDNGSYDWAYKALNRLIQGSCADQMKKALVDADSAGLYIQLQVHDELDGSLQNRRESRLLAEIMQNAVDLPVPFHVDLELGPSWGQITEINLLEHREALTSTMSMHPGIAA